MNIIFLLLILIIILIIIYYIIYKKNINEKFYTPLSDNAKHYRDIANSYETQYNQLLLDIEGYKKQKEDRYNDFINSGNKRKYYNYFLTASNNLQLNTNRLNELLNSKTTAINNAINAENLAEIEAAEIAAKNAADIASKIVSDAKADSDAKALAIIKTEEIEKEQANKIAKEKADEANEAKQKAELAKSVADAAKIEADKAENDAKNAEKIAADALAYANSDFSLDGDPQFITSSGISVSGVSNTNEPFAYNKNEIHFIKL